MPKCPKWPSRCMGHVLQRAAPGFDEGRFRPALTASTDVNNCVFYHYGDKILRMPDSFSVMMDHAMSSHRTTNRHEDMDPSKCRKSWRDFFQNKRAKLVNRRKVS